MPYIDKDRREVLDFTISKIADGCRDWGEVNYVITTIVTKFVLRLGLNYAVINAAIGCFVSAKEEFYRRVVASYEDLKIHENGDIQVYQEVATKIRTDSLSVDVSDAGRRDL